MKPKRHAYEAYRHQKTKETAKEILMIIACFILFIAIIFATMLISTN